MVTLSVIETIWTKFGQNPEFSLRNSVSLSPGPAVNRISTSTNLHDVLNIQPNIYPPIAEIFAISFFKNAIYCRNLMFLSEVI